MGMIPAKKRRLTINDRDLEGSGIVPISGLQAVGGPEVVTIASYPFNPAEVSEMYQCNIFILSC